MHARHSPRAVSDGAVPGLHIVLVRAAPSRHDRTSPSHRSIAHDTSQPRSAPIRSTISPPRSSTATAAHRKPDISQHRQRPCSTRSTSERRAARASTSRSSRCPPTSTRHNWRTGPGGSPPHDCARSYRAESRKRSGNSPPCHRPLPPCHRPDLFASGLGFVAASGEIQRPPMGRIAWPPSDSPVRAQTRLDQSLNDSLTEIAHRFYDGGIVLDMG